MPCVFRDTLSVTVNLPLQRLAGWLLLIAALLPLAATAQIVITDGVQTYPSLAGTTVTMSNRCELRITGTSTPLSGCTINLNSSDAWLFLTGIKPSAVVSTYLGQIFVSGAAAVADSNIRVVQYGAGAVVIPQPPSFQPLQAFSGPHFTGTSAKYSQYAYYTGTGLGVMDMNISSFKLKRGYMAVMAQNTGGNGISKCYIAQDGDLEISILPATLENHIRFIYVTPWRWTSKKGIAGDPGISLLNVNWWYNWNIDQNSSRDLEYLPIRAQRWWPSLSQNWQSRGANTVLGYNEPDSTAQANIAVGDAIWSWPDLLGTGLRVGAPAVTDGGWSWITNFMSQADAAGLRVDFVPLHYYQAHNPADASGAATQMYNFLKARYDQFKRPLWVTEWNNGANWTDNNPYAPPTYAQQQACVAAMVSMLESTPFVERYAIYNWVEDVRSVVDTNGNITAAGVSYRDQVSAPSYKQTLPDNGTRSLAEYLFETNTLDGSGYGNNALAATATAFTTGHKGQAVVLDGTNNYLQLPPNLGIATNFSFAAWVNWNGGVNWQRLFDFGDDTSHYLFLTPSSGSGTLRFAINNGGGEQMVEATGALPNNQWVHVCVTLSGATGKIYTNGVLAASSSSFSITPASFTPMFNYLGKSQFAADPLFAGKLDEVQINDYALTAAQVAALVTNSPPAFSTNLIVRPNASEAVAYSNSIAGLATDPDAGDTLTYSKTYGPAWLNLGTNGTLTGTPGAADAGTNYFTVRATDAAGASAFSLVAIYVSVIATNGVWITDGDGLWSAYANWSGGAVGNGIGQTADFSTLNITANRTVTLDSKRSLGTLKFGDTSGTQNWTLISSGGITLTLDTGSVTSPAIVVNQNTVTNLVSMAGTNGFTKSGGGTFILAADTSISGTMNLDTGSTANFDGIVRAANPGALDSASLLQFRNNTGGSAGSTLQLDGTNGNITTLAAVALNGRNANIPAIQNLSGSNTISGAININVGGGFYIFQSDAGQLNLGGISSLATGSRALTFQGGGDFAVSGSITNGSATAMSLTKTGAGTLTLTGNNTYSGTTTISAGTLQVGTGGANGTIGTNSVTDNGVLAFNRSGTINAPFSISGSGSLVKQGSSTLTISNANTYAGGTTLWEGIIQLNQNSALGTGAIICNATNGTGRIILANGLTATNSLTANAVAPGVATGMIMINDNTSATWSGPINIYSNAANGGHFAGPATSGLLTISGTIISTPTNIIMVRLGNVRFSGGGNYGELQVRANTTSLGANNGIASNAALDLAGNGSTTSPTALDLNGFNQTLAGLKNVVTAANVAWVTNSGAPTNTLTLNLGNTNYSFGGSIVGRIAVALNAGAQTLTKSGTSALNGLYTFSGNTTLSGGTLVLGSGMTLPNTPVITVGAGGTLDVSASGLTLGATQTLKGNGTVLGNLSVNGTLSPGGNIGVLTCSNSVTLQSGSTTIIELNKALGTNDQLRVVGPLTCAGTLAVTNLAGSLAGGDSFQLFSATSSAGNFSLLAGSPGAGLDWKFNSTNGVLMVYSTVATNLTASITNNALQISWPADHLGWILQVQTNGLGAGLGTHWISLPDSTTTTQFTVPLDTRNTSVFYRLVYQ